MLSNYITQWYGIECEKCTLDINAKKFYFLSFNKMLSIWEVVGVKEFDASPIGEREFPITEEFEDVGVVNKQIETENGEVWVPQSFNTFGLIQKEFNAESICFLAMPNGNWVVRLNRR